MEDDVVIRIRGLKKAFKIIDPNVKHARFGSKKYSDYPVFDGLDLDVRKGDIVAILGRNGCGKSTFLKIVSQIVEPDEGTVEVEGRIASILELSMGFHGDLSGRDNIILRSELYGIPRNEVLKHIDEIAEYSDLGVFIDNPVRTYSSGMRSRLAFAVMVNVDADIFLVDEALSTGDLAFASKASEHLKNLVRSGKTVLFTSHSLGTIKRTCTRAVWINEHRIFMDGPAEEVCDAYAKSINESVEETLSLANGGSSAAQYRLATFYRDGNGLERDPERYHYWLEEAAKREHPMACAELADILMAEGTEESAARAEALYQQAADAGNFDARRKYATMQGDTYGDIMELRDVMKGLAASEYPYDIYNCGNMIYKSALTPDDYAEAFQYVEKASEAGWLDADVLLAQMYRDGMGVDRSIEKSVEILKSAAERGNIKAMAILADQYLNGKFVDRDPEEAFRWFLKSAQTGNPKSQYQTAVMLSSGLGTEKDLDKAKEWFAIYSSTMVNEFRRIAIDTMHKRQSDEDVKNDLIKAASRCYNTVAMVALSGKYLSGRGFKKNPEAARRLLERAAVAGGSPRTHLALLYLEGEGVEKDQERAFQLLRSAADAGDSSGMYNLALMYKDGIACEPDQDKYRMLVRMAAERGNRDAKFLVAKWDNRIKRRKEGSGRKDGEEPENVPDDAQDKTEPADKKEPEKKTKTEAAAVPNTGKGSGASDKPAKKKSSNAKKNNKPAGKDDGSKKNNPKSKQNGKPAAKSPEKKPADAAKKQAGKANPSVKQNNAGSGRKKSGNGKGQKPSERPADRTNEAAPGSEKKPEGNGRRHHGNRAKWKNKGPEDPGKGSPPSAEGGQRGAIDGRRLSVLVREMQSHGRGRRQMSAL